MLSDKRFPTSLRPPPVIRREKLDLTRTSETTLILFHITQPHIPEDNKFRDSFLVFLAL
jgi:hypothetical protein